MRQSCKQSFLTHAPSVIKQIDIFTISVKENWYVHLEVNLFWVGCLWKVTETWRCLVGNDKGKNAILSAPLYNVTCEIKNLYNFSHYDENIYISKKPNIGVLNVVWCVMWLFSFVSLNKVQTLRGVVVNYVMMVRVKQTEVLGCGTVKLYCIYFDHLFQACRQ
jgi:hypothetical protein